MAKLYALTPAYDEGRLKVSELHTIHYEQSGNPEGVPVIFLHGGPGGGISPDYRRFFDPKRWRIVMFDQRGCGQSTPFAELKENTTWDLVEDIRKLRLHLGIQKWHVFGGSWGSTLALAYSTKHPDECLGLILRGIFMLRKREIDWFYQEGCSRIYPDAWENYLAPIPESERGNLVEAFYKRLTSEDPDVRSAAAKAWSIWEGSTSKLIQDPAMIDRFSGDRFAEAFARIECHYFINRGFFDSDDYLLRQVHKIRHIPGVIIQGRYDVVCPAESAWDLHKAWPEADFHMVQDCGHSASEPGITARLVEATDRFASLAGSGRIQGT